MSWFKTKEGPLEDAELAACLEEDGLVADFVADARQWKAERDFYRARAKAWKRLAKINKESEIAAMHVGRSAVLVRNAAWERLARLERVAEAARKVYALSVKGPETRKLGDALAALDEKTG